MADPSPSPPAAAVNSPPSVIPPGLLYRAHFEQAVADLLERLDDMRTTQPQAIADAIRQVLRDPDTARTIVDNMAAAAQERATTAAGQGVWWVLRNVVARWVVIALVVVTAAKVLGWDLATKLGKWLTGATA